LLAAFGSVAFVTGAGRSSDASAADSAADTQGATRSEPE
jgi:hypothetical protein